MSEPGDKHTDSKGANRANQLPNPELNPLMNPILGQNLGRWAQVYITNPPEKREQAVTALLRELESQTPGAMAAHKFGVEKSVDEARARHEVVCPGCRRRNEATQRFCGFCGSFLQADLAATAEHEPKNRAADETSAHATPTAPDNAIREIQWLRSKALLSTDQPEPATHPRWKFGKLTFWIAGLAILLVGFAYLISVRRVSSDAHRSPGAIQPAVSPMPASQGTPHAESRGPEGMAPPGQRIAAAADLPAPAADQTATAANGTDELRLAQRYLKGTSAARDSSQAAQWLWKAVAKHNTNAILLLADLYLHGDGVPRSCDQARLLLVAAAERGAAEADQKLSSLDSNGCQ